MDTDVTRTLVEAVERELMAVEGAAPEARETSVTALRGSWERLVTQLALGPAPEVRACPACHGKIMKAATRCMHCWTKSLALPEPTSTPDGGGAA